MTEKPTHRTAIEKWLDLENGPQHLVEEAKGALASGDEQLQAKVVLKIQHGLQGGHIPTPAEEMEQEIAEIAQQQAEVSQQRKAKREEAIDALWEQIEEIKTRIDQAPISTNPMGAALVNALGGGRQENGHG